MAHSDISIPDDEQAQAVQASVQMVSHTGPLPHPAILKEYDRIVPGGAERIFHQFEQQALHRQRVELSIVRSNSFVQVFGALTASLLGLIGMGGGLFLVYQGKGLAGFGVFLTALAALAGTFVYGKKAQTRDRKED